MNLTEFILYEPSCSFCFAFCIVSSLLMGLGILSEAVENL